MSLSQETIINQYEASPSGEVLNPYIIETTLMTYHRFHSWPVVQNSQTLKHYLSRFPYNLCETRESEQLLSVRVRSLQEIKVQIRRDLAIHLLNRKGLSVEEISGRLLFFEPSAFIRAFKSWTGLTSLNYRCL